MGMRLLRAAEHRSRTYPEQTASRDQDPQTPPRHEPACEANRRSCSGQPPPLDLNASSERVWKNWSRSAGFAVGRTCQSCRKSIAIR
jgi:hypothetical protein